MLPAALVVSDELLLAAAIGGGDNLWPVFFVWLVAQTALMSLAAGKWLESWFWRVIVLTWTSLLLNVLLFHVAALRIGNGIFDAHLLAGAFLAAQFCLLAAWLVLGTSSWQWRLPAAVIALLPAGLVVAELDRSRLSLGDVWKEIAALQVTTTFLFAALLRWRGYRVERLDEGASPGAAGPAAVSQFSLSHLLTWTAALAPLLLLLQTLDYAFLRWLNWRQTGVLIVDGVLLAPVALTSFWAALGRGRSWSKVVLLALIAAAMGAALYIVEDQFATVPAWLAGKVSGTYVWVGKSYVIKITNMGLSWLVWPPLCAFLLAGMLLVFRASGYRLTRSKRPHAAGGQVELSASNTGSSSLFPRSRPEQRNA